MNQSVCYDANWIIEWQQLIEVSNVDFWYWVRFHYVILWLNHIFNTSRWKLIIKKWVLKLENRSKILFQLLIKIIPSEAIIEVWHVWATGIKGIGHYMILLNKGTHLYTCLLLINKGLVCYHFLRVGTYSQYAIFHISIILNWWYLDTNIHPNDLLQQHPFIPVCGITQKNVETEKNINFQHFFLF
jgi:hypothetical protein